MKKICSCGHEENMHHAGGGRCLHGYGWREMGLDIKPCACPKFCPPPPVEEVAQGVHTVLERACIAVGEKHLQSRLIEKELRVEICMTPKQWFRWIAELSKDVYG